MYLALMLQSFARMRRRIWHATLMRSGLVTMLMLAILLIGLAFGWQEHRLGHFGQLKRELKQKPAEPEAAIAKPGGQDVIFLQRSQLPGGAGPEFLSATLLPGRGMNVLQITAYLPQKGEVPLLASPPLAEATRLMNGTGSDETGGESLAMGGAIEVPWAGVMSGTTAADRQNLTTVWRGRHLSLPIAEGSSMAMGGLLLRMASNSVTTNVMPDGGEAQATFHAADFNGHWVSQTEVTTAIELSSRAIEMTITARNMGNEPEPMAIGWQPRFAIPSGQREQALLRLPTGERTEVQDRRTGLPSGRLLAVAGTEYDFTAHDGSRLGSLSLDDCFVHLRAGLMDNGPVAEIRDPADNYGLRLTAISSNIKAMQVSAPAGSAFVSIDPRFNYNDPFGREWLGKEDTGMVVLEPGQSVQWKIRLEIFSLTHGETPRL
jgi:aldose 1-epimerase